MGMLSGVFGRFFKNFEALHNEILEGYENGTLSPDNAICEIHVNANELLPKNDPRRMEAFRTIFCIASKAFYDGIMSADEAAIAISFSANEILQKNPDMRSEAFAQIMYFWNIVYQEGSKRYEGSSIDMYSASRFISNAAQKLLPASLSKECLNLLRDVYSSELLDIALERIEKIAVAPAHKAALKPPSHFIFSMD